MSAKPGKLVAMNAASSTFTGSALAVPSTSADMAMRWSMWVATSPPPGAPHHYVFQVFALDTKLDLPATATRDDVEKAMASHVLGQGVIVGLFSR